MPQRETRFNVAAPPAAVWAFVRDVQALCSCIPGVEQVTLLDHRTAELTVKERIGVVPLTVSLRAQIDAEDPPHRLHATATAQHLRMEIDVSLRASGRGTEMLGLIQVRGEGPLKPVVDSLFERRADERAAQFAEQLERRFGATGSGVPAEPATATPPVPASSIRGRVARIGASLARYWQRLFGSRAGPSN